MRVMIQRSISSNTNTQPSKRLDANLSRKHNCQHDHNSGCTTCTSVWCKRALLWPFTGTSAIGTRLLSASHAQVCFKQVTKWASINIKISSCWGVAIGPSALRTVASIRGICAWWSDWWGEYHRWVTESSSAISLRALLKAAFKLSSSLTGAVLRSINVSAINTVYFLHFASCVTPQMHVTWVLETHYIMDIRINGTVEKRNPWVSVLWYFAWHLRIAAVLRQAVACCSTPICAYLWDICTNNHSRSQQ